MTAAPTNPLHPTWKYVLAFALVYVSWGTTYWAIKRGVESFPPWYFGGFRILLAGMILLGYLALRGEGLKLGRRDLVGAAIAGVLMFVFGNGLITLGEQTVDSGVAAVMVATAPLWVALWETVWPRGEKLRPAGWLGVLAGLAGVALLVEDPGRLLIDAGPLLVVGSSFFWATGSFFLRHWKRTGSLLLSAAYQMVIGGIGQIVIGTLLGEPAQLFEKTITPIGIYSFFHLLVIGSLIGFVAYNWLLGHVSATLAGTYSYVNPVVALLFSMLVTDERVLHWRIWCGMAVILAGVALVRLGVSALPRVRLSAAETPAAAAFSSVGVTSVARAGEAAGPCTVAARRVP